VRDFRSAIISVSFNTADTGSCVGVLAQQFPQFLEPLSAFAALKVRWRFWDSGVGGQLFVLLSAMHGSFYGASIHS
jgi:hypothetical protein